MFRLLIWILVFGILVFIFFAWNSRIDCSISSVETSIIGYLRSLATSQNQFQNLGLKDRDKDGIGEYGYFVELAGITPLPVGTEFKPVAKPTFVNSVFGKTSQENGGIAEKSGYYFKIYLPETEKTFKGETGEKTVSVSKLPPTEKETKEIEYQENKWCAYAWPKEAGKKGNKAYFINERGEVIATSNLPAGMSTLYYSGKERMPEVYDIYQKKENGALEIVFGVPLAHGLVWNPTS